MTMATLERLSASGGQRNRDRAAAPGDGGGSTCGKASARTIQVIQADDPAAGVMLEFEYLRRSSHVT